MDVDKRMSNLTDRRVRLLCQLSATEGAIRDMVDDGVKPLRNSISKSLRTPAQEYADRPAMLCPANADPATVQYFSALGYRMIPIGRIG